ncbi:hypothetical protein C8R43DRAFT_589418 [Mycena crocata]|nr:hypothetical protein C8R43DRAFT_589418 [Mycena crocata]
MKFFSAKSIVAALSLAAMSSGAPATTDTDLVCTVHRHRRLHASALMQSVLGRSRRRRGRRNHCRKRRPCRRHHRPGDLPAKHLLQFPWHSPRRLARRRWHLPKRTRPRWLHLRLL